MSQHPPRAAHHSPFAWTRESTDGLARAGLLRTLRPRRADRPLADLAGNDYLGLARHPHVAEAAAGAAHRWGAGATGSRLVTGSTEAHHALEEELAQFCGAQAALVFSSGYAANLAAVTALTGPGGLVVSDAANHASLIDGCRLSRARTAVVPHADPGAVDAALAGHAGRALVVSDTVFSVDGEAADLPALAGVCRARGAGLLVDDAHGLGVLGRGGRGAVHAAGLAGDPGVVCTVTLSKALGGQGGAVLGPREVVGHLLNTARTFVFDTALAPPSVASARAALAVLRREPERADRARAVARALHDGLRAAGLAVTRPQACVLSLRAPSPEAAVRWSADCAERGLAVGCFRPPSVPDGVSRLRLTARADLGDETVARAVAVVAECAPAGATGEPGASSGARAAG